jgi:teichuronic acid biosynthesis glycosyltransferase TuaG
VVPQVSIVLPFRNQGPFLAQACRSLKAQSMREWECLLVNDGSGLQARLVAEAISTSDDRFRLLHVPNDNHFPGPWLARNHGLLNARSELIAFLDADDLWHPYKLERQLPLHTDQGIELSVTGYHRFHETTRILSETRRPPLTLEYRRLLRGNCIPLSTVIINRGWLEQPFRPERHEDYGLWLRLFARKPPPRYGCLTEPLMAYRLHDSSLSSKRGRSILAVEKLFRSEFHHRGERLVAIAAWALKRTLGMMKSSCQYSLTGREKLPGPFSDYTTPSTITCEL